MNHKKYRRRIESSDVEREDSTLFKLLNKIAEISREHPLMVGTVVLSGALHQGLKLTDIESSRKAVHDPVANISESAKNSSGFFIDVAQKLQIDIDEELKAKEPAPVQETVLEKGM